MLVSKLSGIQLSICYYVKMTSYYIYLICFYKLHSCFQWNQEEEKNNNCFLWKVLIKTLQELVILELEIL